MIKVDQETLDKMESQHKGIIVDIMNFDKAELPSCPQCKSTNTASVQAGIIGRTIYIASATTKVLLVPNRTDEMGKYCCNECKSYFD
jgi:hypothetical protein